MLLISAPLSAQSNGDDISAMTIDQLLQVTVATKNRKSLYQAPANVTVFTRQDIEYYGLNTLQELLMLVPGFYASRDIEQGNMHRISVRGRSSSLSESVLVLLDGQRLNDLYSGGATLLNRELSLTNAEQVEIIRGPGSALYGSNAFLGVINIITREAGNEVAYETGNFSHQRGHWLASGQFKDANEWRLFFESFSDKGQRYNALDSFGLQQSTRDPMSGFDFNASISLGNWLINSRFMERSAKNFLVFGNHGDSNKEYTRQWSMSFKHDKRMSDNWQFSTQFSLSRDLWNTRATLIPQGVEFAPELSLDEDFIGGPLLRNQTLELQMDHSIFLVQDQSLLLGIQLYDNKVLDVANVTTHDPVTLEYFDGFRYNRNELNFSVKESREIIGAYVQHQWEISPQWQLTSGLRVDNYSDFGQSVNPRLALIWSYAEQSSLKFLYATAFRAPNFLELYDRNNPVDFGNPELNAEQVETSEIAWFSRLGQWRYELNLFYNEFEDLIKLGQPVVHPENPLLAPTFMNGEASHNFGMESVLQYYWESSSEIIAKWSWLKNNRFVQTPLVHWSVQYLKHWENHSLSISANHFSANPEVSEQKGYSLLNGHWRFTPSKQWALEFSVKNVLDKSFRTQTTVFDNGVPNRGRQWTFTATYQLN